MWNLPLEDVDDDGQEEEGEEREDPDVEGDVSGHGEAEDVEGNDEEHHHHVEQGKPAVILVYVHYY
jgi:hypothetical protein